MASTNISQEDGMKTFLFRFSLAAALALATVALGVQANGQTSGAQDPAATAPPQQQAPAATPQEPTASSPNNPASDPTATSQQNEPQMPTAGSEAQTQDARAFTGTIVKQSGKIVLMDPVTKTTYQIDDVSKVKPYMGKQVKVTGKLDMDSNMIHVTSIELVSTD
jgi:hypothetical protein